jgi:hypothetical protein
LLIRSRHNQLPADTLLSEADVLILSDEFKELCSILAKHNAQDSFRLRLLHRHMPILEGQILLGTRITEAVDAVGYWSTPTCISMIDLGNIYPHIYAVDATNEEDWHLYPVEFREGSSANSDNVDGGFFTEFTDYLRAKGLGNTFGLETVQSQTGKTIEFSFDTGNILLDEGMVKTDMIAEGRGWFRLQDTVWSVTVKDKIVQYTTGETRCAELRTGHVKITNSQARSALDVLRILKDEGILAVDIRAE